MVQKRKPLKISWRAWCIDRLARRDYSAFEMREMIKKRAADSDQSVDADEVVDKLVEDGFVDDRRYIENQIAMHTGTFSLKGPRELEKKFRIKGGLTASLIAEYIDFDSRKWFDLARNYCRGLFPGDFDEPDSVREIPVKQFFKLKNRLYGKGFTRSQIEYALSDFKPLREKKVAVQSGEVERLIQKRMAAGRGPYDILQFIKQKGYPEKEIQPCLELPDEVWIELASRERTKRFGRGKPGSTKEKRKQSDFLRRRGFYFEHIRQVLDQL